MLRSRRHTDGNVGYDFRGNNSAARSNWLFLLVDTTQNGKVAREVCSEDVRHTIPTDVLFVFYTSATITSK